MSWRARGGLGLTVALTLWLGTLPLAAQPADSNEIPIERCDVLPVVRAKVAGQDARFLLDTGATTVLNLKSFSGDATRKIRIDSWRGAAATSAREVTIPDFKLGSHTLHDLQLPAIDLSPIGKACGGRIDGLLGVDLMDRLGVTIDLQRKVAMHHCNVAFNEANAAVLEDCFDPEIVLYTPDGEYRGRKEVMQYMNKRYFRFAPGLRFEMSAHDVRSFGDALWYSYDYRVDIDKANQHRAGHGVAMCRRTEGKWQILNMHNAELEPENMKKP